MRFYHMKLRDVQKKLVKAKKFSYTTLCQSIQAFFFAQKRQIIDCRQLIKLEVKIILTIF